MVGESHYEIPDTIRLVKRGMSKTGRIKHKSETASSMRQSMFYEDLLMVIIPRLTADVASSDHIVKASYSNVLGVKANSGVVGIGP